MKRNEQLAIVVVMILALGTPLLAMLAGVRPNVDENRELTAAPTIDAAAVLDDTTWAQLGDFLTDRFPARDHAIELDAGLRRRISFAEAAREGVPRGADGWLYHADTLVDDCLGPPTQAFFSKGDKIPDRAERAGTPFLFVVIPDKVVVYPDHQAPPGLAGVLGLDESEDLPGCAEEWYGALVDAASGRDWLWYLGPELAEAAVGSDELLYYQRDTHWTNTGAMHYVEGILDRLAPGTFDPAEVVRGEDVRAGDLARMKGMTWRESRTGLRVERPGVAVVQEGPSGRSTTEPSTTRATSTEAPLVEGTTVLLGDSFTRQSLPLLRPYFEELVFLHHDYLREGTIGEALGGRVADRIVVGEVQRNVAKGWYVTFMDAVNQHLVHEQGGR